MRKLRIFYGWFIVGAGLLITVDTGVIFYGFTSLVEPLVNEFGWSYAQVSFASSLLGLEIGLLAPLVGFFVDRVGPRKVLFSGALLIGLGLILLSHTHSLAVFYLSYITIAMGMTGCTSGVLMTAVANWFRRRVGIATGVATCGFGLSGVLVPIVSGLIDSYGWRTAVFILAFIVMGIALPLSLVMRHKPEQYGLLPDGVEVTKMESRPTPVLEEGMEKDFRIKQALKSRAFWHISIAVAVELLVLTAVVSHVMPYLSEVSLPRKFSAYIASAIPLISIIGRLGLGWLGDLMEKKMAMAIGFAMMGMGLVGFVYVSAEKTWPLLPFIIFFSVGFGGLNPLRASMVREYFGRTNFGAIHGIVMGIMMFGSISGAPLAGWVFDTWGSYRPIWFVFILFTGIGFFLMTTSPSAEATRNISKVRYGGGAMVR